MAFIVDDHQALAGSLALKNKATIFNWGERSSLGHSCWQCGTKGNSPRARITCYGIHSEPCVKYHQGMHAIGKSHECKPCVRGEEVHLMRHKAIADMIINIHKIDTFGTIYGPGKVELRLSTPGDITDVGIHATRARANSNDTENSSSTTPSLTLCNMSAAQRRQEKKALKNAKSQAKAHRNQSRFDIGATSKDVDTVAEAIHGLTSGLSLANHNPNEDIESIIQRNINYVSAVHSMKKLYRSGAVETLTGKDKQKIPEKEGMINRVQDILNQLGIAGLESKSSDMPTANNTAHASTPSKVDLDGKMRKERQSLLSRATRLIQEDIEKSDAEERETLIRMAGYWRFVNKSIYNQMMANHVEWEWATGHKIADLEELEEKLAEEMADVDEGGANERQPFEGGEGWIDLPEDWDEETAVTDDERDAELEALHSADGQTSINLAYCRFILMPENEHAYRSIILANLEALVLAVKESDNNRATKESALNIGIFRLLELFHDHEFDFFPINFDDHNDIIFSNLLLDGPSSEDDVFKQLFLIDEVVVAQRAVIIKLENRTAYHPYIPVLRGGIGSKTEEDCEHAVTVSLEDIEAIERAFEQMARLAERCGGRVRAIVG